MTKIKICGLTTPQDVFAVNEVRADFAGMVLFYPKSKRNLSLEKAKQLLRLLDPSIRSVAVTVSPSLDEVHQISKAGFDYIQIHGDMEKSLWNESPLPVLRAFNITDPDSFESRQQRKTVAGYVFDAATPGSGQGFDWSLVPPVSGKEQIWLLAGGLHEGNVSDAIRSLHPYGVDVSSGVETNGLIGKDVSKIRAFVRAVRSADQAETPEIPLK